MALYVGNGKKLKIKMVNSVGDQITDAIYKLLIGYPMVEGIKLIVADDNGNDHILTDKHGVYITVISEGEDE